MAQDNTPLFSWFNFSPDTTTITDTSTIMGSNIEEGDGPIERYVLQKVGSYGYQLNRIIDVLSILLERAMADGQILSDLKPNALADGRAVPTGKMAQQSIDDFYAMATKAARASEACKRQATVLAAHRWIKRMQRLRDSENETDRELYQSVKDKITKGLE